MATRKRTSKKEPLAARSGTSRAATTRQKRIVIATSPAVSLAEEIQSRQGTLSRQRAAASRVLRAHEKRLLARKGVVGVDVGLKMTNDDYVRPARYVIRVHVAAKLGDAQLTRKSRIPRQIDGIDVDVLERRYVCGANQAVDPEHRLFRDPLSGGVAISGDKGATFGTLGMRVFRDGAAMFLTNAHVVPQAGAEVWQPPTKGANTPVGTNRVIGIASQHRQRDDRTDCALVTATGTRGFQGLVLGLPADVQYRVGALKTRDENVTEVFKMGAKTGHDPTLIGVVDNVSASIHVEDMTFVGQIAVRGKEPGVFADRGDSGAILLRRTAGDDAFEIVGLVHTTTADNRVAVASHFKRVVAALDFTLQDDH